MLFISEKEIKSSKSEVIKYFSDINTLEKFKALNLPVIKQTDCSDGTNNKAFEIDLSKKAELKKIIGVNKFDCYPLLFVVSSPSKTEYSVRFQQRIAA